MASNNQYIRLSEWARRMGMHRHTAWRHYQSGALPANLAPVKIGGIVYVLENPDGKSGRTFGYARVSSGEQKPQLEPQANRLWAYAGQNGIQLAGVIQETASGLNDRRPKLLKLLSDPTVNGILVEHRDRLARFGVGMVDAMLQARGGGGVMVIDAEEVEDDLVRDMTEILTCFCARLYGRRSVANKARRALAAAANAKEAAE